MPHSDVHSRVKPSPSVVLLESKHHWGHENPVLQTYEPDRPAWPVSTANYKSSCKPENNRQEITEGICQQCSWLGRNNVPLACFSTQTLEANSSPIQSSRLDKHWWIPGAEAANRDFIPLFFLIYIFPAPSNCFAFQWLLHSYRFGSPFRSSWGHIHHGPGLKLAEGRINHEHLQQEPFSPSPPLSYYTSVHSKKEKASEVT